MPDVPPGLQSVFLDQDEGRPNDLQTKHRAQEELSPQQEEERRDLRRKGKRDRLLKRMQEQGSPLRTKEAPSPEATTPVTDNNCRKCGHTRTEVVPHCCKCGHQYVDGS